MKTLDELQAETEAEIDRLTLEQQEIKTKLFNQAMRLSEIIKLQEQLPCKMCEAGSHEDHASWCTWVNNSDIPLYDGYS